MADKKSDQKKPAIPHNKKTKNLLKEAEGYFKVLMESRGKVYGFIEGPKHPYPRQNLDLYYNQLEEFVDILKKFVPIDNTQLHHPFVKWILNSPGT